MSSQARSIPFNGERGFITLMMVGMFILLLIFVMGFYTLYEGQSASAAEDGQHLVALNLAEAGVDHVVWRIRQNPLWRNVPDEQDVPLRSGTYHLKQLVVESSGLKGFRMLGCTPDRFNAKAVCAEVYTEVVPVYATVVAGAFVGDAAVTISSGAGVNLDSYRSDNGPYSAPILGPITVPIQTSNKGPGKRPKGGIVVPTSVAPRTDDGDIATNNTQPGSIQISGTVSVKGHVYYPQQGTPAVVALNGTGTISGGVGPNPADTRFHPIPGIPAGAVYVRPINNGFLGTVGLRTLAGQTLSPPYPPATYVIQNDTRGVGLDVRSTPLVFDGSDQTVVYLDGNAKLGGLGLQNNAALPPNLAVYGTPNCRNITFKGTGKFYGAVYAPNADIYLNGSDELFGSLSGRTIVVNGSNTRFHYDEALRDNLLYVYNYQLSSWTQIR